MTTSKNKLPGIALIHLLLERADRLDMDKHELCRSIDMTYPYLNALANGHRPITGISHDKLRKIGSFLGLPFMQVLMLAEIVAPEDFVHENDNEIDAASWSALKAMRNEPEWGRVAPSDDEWKSLSLRTRLGFVLMWEIISSKRYLNHAKQIKLSVGGGGQSLGSLLP